MAFKVPAPFVIGVGPPQFQKYMHLISQKITPGLPKHFATLGPSSPPEGRMRPLTGPGTHGPTLEIDFGAYTYQDVVKKRQGSLAVSL